METVDGETRIAPLGKFDSGISHSFEFSELSSSTLIVVLIL